MHKDYSAALASKTGRPLALTMGNDGNYGGVAEARLARGDTKTTVLMFMPGSGLGCAFVGPDGLPLEGDTLAGLETGHAPAPLHLLDGIRPFPCGCGRSWGCCEAYTAISGLPYLLAEKTPEIPRSRVGRIHRERRRKR